MIDWTDETQMISQYFSVKEALWLPSWGRMANESDGLNDEIKQNLMDLCNKLDTIREYLDVPMITESMYRPPQYSISVGGLLDDPHTQGKGVDLVPSNINITDAKNKLLPMLESWNVRMEDDPTNNHIHIDTCPVIYNRYFKP